MSAAFADLVAVRDEIANHEKVEAELKQKIQQRMANASRAVFETGVVSWKCSKDGIGVDMEKLLKEQPDLLRRYAKNKSGSRRFLIST
jgi:predicted phage-related endonuclease